MSDTELLHKAIDSAKNFQNFQDVLLAVSLHPEWLTFIPEHRKWAILHQIIFSGNVDNLEQLLALQKKNQDFRLLTNTHDNETIIDIANLRKDAPAMTKRIQQLVKLDEMLSYARDGRWDECYNIAKENPTLINEKPPYRRYYLIHHMAAANAIQQFERFKQIKGFTFNPTLKAEGKKINVIAQEANHPEFAAYIEEEFPGLLDTDDLAHDELYKPSEEAVKYTKAITSMIQKNIAKDLDQDLMGDSFKPKSRNEALQHLNDIRTQDQQRQNQASNTVSKVEEDKRKILVLDILTCPLTLNIFIDPVVAADGCTYERSAITKWLAKNDRSPVTNQPFAHRNLNPNLVINQIITALKS